MNTEAAWRTWGSTPDERAMVWPGDDLMASPDLTLHRGIDVEAPAAVVFRRLCQLRVAPYSYDWLDNFGRRSPRELIAGLERLELGQRFMTIFRLVAFEPDWHVTVRSRSALVTYLVVPRNGDRSRLAVRVRWTGRGVPLPRSISGGLLGRGDFVMMRRQLLNLKRLAEEDHTATRATGS
jgi:hypothetical protein